MSIDLSQLLRLALAAACARGLAACADAAPSAQGNPDHAPASVAAPTSQPLPAAALVSEESRPALCDRPGDDIVRAAFCADQPAHVESLAELQRVLGLKLIPDAQDELPAPQPGMYVEPPSYATAVLLTHSTALSGELVSPLNPRAIVMTYNTFLTFNRGVQQVEMAVRDRTSYRVNLYLLQFRQACNQEAHGCSHGDLYGPGIEQGWEQVALQDDEDLKNTPADCRQCHQRGLAEPMLLMRELDGPWTHFFAPDSQPSDGSFPEPLGDALVRDYVAAKGDEPYANIPTDFMQKTIGFFLQSLVNGDQPLIFDGSAILNERWPWSPDGYPAEPQRSQTWQDNYEAFKRGEQLPLPFYAPRATDPQKQAQLTAAYADFRAGTLAAADLPDLADIFPDDAQTLAEIGLATEPDAAPADLLIQACASCHNDVLDQSLSRARFNVNLGKLPRAELDAAIGRLQLPPGSPAAMPPAGRRQLDEGARKRLIDYLKEWSAASSPDAERLAHAAEVGMAQRQPHKPPSGPASIR